MTGANVDIPEYDFVISDGVNPVGLMATADKPSAVRRIPRGQGVEDKDHVQSDWSGGRGASVVEADPDKFYDSYSAWTDRAGQVTPAPLPGFGVMPTSGSYRAVSNWPSRTAANAPYLYTSVSAYLATKVTTTATYANPHFFFWAAASGTFEVQLRSDSAGSPGAIVTTASLTSQDAGVRLYGAQFGASPVAGPYWLVIRNPGGISLEVVTNATTTNTAISSNGSSWTLGAGLVPYYYYGHYSIDQQVGGKFFEYKRGLYYAVNVWSNTYLYLSGIRGLANGSGSGATILSPAGLSNDQYNGHVYIVSNGPYEGEARIIDDEIGQDVALSGAFRHSYAAPHEYVIRGSDLWTEKVAIVGGEVTDIAVVGEWVYLARGDSLPIIRYREYNNAGTWTVDAVAEATYAEKLKVVTRAGKKVIYRIWGGASALRRKYFSKADVPDTWGVALTWGTDAPVSTDGSMAQDMLDFDGTIWITTEADWYEIHDTGAGEFVAKRPGPSETSMRDPNNGLGAVWWNSNFFATYAEGYMRGYGRTIDDIGPNRGEGLPSDRRGNVTSAAPMFNTMAVSISQYNTANLYASILTTIAPGGSWHELFRSPYQNVWIQSLFYESIPGIQNRLWFTMGDHVMFLYMPNSAQNPLNDYQVYTNAYGNTFQTGMLYAPTAQFTTGWIDFGNPDLDHYWRQLRVFTENLGAGATKPGFGTNLGTGLIKASITTWPSTESTLTDITTSPVQYVTVKKKGKRAQLKFELRSSNASIPAVLRSYTLRGRQMNEVKFDVQINFTHMNQMQLLNGSQALDANEQVAAVMAQFDAWQENGDLLTLTSRIKIFDGLEGHIDPVPVTPTAWENETADISGNVVFRQL